MHGTVRKHCERRAPAAGMSAHSGPVLLLLLLVAAAEPAAAEPVAAGPAAAGVAAPPLWTVTATSAGVLTLLFNVSARGGAPQLKLSAGCPAISLAPGEQPTSLCDPLHYAGASLGASSGTDPRLGAFEQHTISYRPRALQGRGVAASLDIRAFHPPLRVVYVQLRLGAPLATNRIEPLSGAIFSFRSDTTRRRVLNVPLDNDIQSVYQSVPVGAGALEPGTSCYVTAVYDEASREGLVMGFLENELWKTGVRYSGRTLDAIAGINGKLLTRDAQPHGTVTDTTTSPLLSIGHYEDWRLGMEDYATMQRESGGSSGGKPKPLPLGLDGSPPAGWNPWAMSVDGNGQPNLTNIAAASKVLAGARPDGFGPTQFVTRDAVYGLNLSATKIWIERVTAAGQLAGSYESPFVWYDIGEQHNQTTISCASPPNDPRQGAPCANTSSPGASCN